MKHLIILLGLFSLFTMNPAESIAQDYKKIAGEWKFSTPEAPYGYQSGTITFTQASEEIEGEVKFPDGYKIDLKNIEIKNNDLNFGLYVDYEYIKVNMTLEKNKLSGFVESPDGKLKITAER